ncbi:MAG: uracil-DNA glycosylase [Bacilli bacterium]|nr:uracil-DNA glycosylase [Bacilli bacterium]
MINNDWDEVLKSEIIKPYFLKLQDYLQYEYENKTIFPPQEEIYTALKLCSFKHTKVIIIGQDPYHNFNQAHGLAFSVKQGTKIPPSLRNIFKELENNYHINLPLCGDLTSWAKEGVLLLNTILTVEAHKPLSHQNIGWEQFTNEIIKKCNEDNRPKVFVLWGNSAIKKKDFITNNRHLVISSSHPSPLSARHSFFGSEVFLKINQFLVNTDQNPIDFKLN